MSVIILGGTLFLVSVSSLFLRFYSVSSYVSFCTCLGLFAAQVLLSFVSSERLFRGFMGGWWGAAFMNCAVLCGVAVFTGFCFFFLSSSEAGAIA